MLMIFFSFRFQFEFLVLEAKIYFVWISDLNVKVQLQVLGYNVTWVQRKLNGIYMNK